MQGEAGLVGPRVPDDGNDPHGRSTGWVPPLGWGGRGSDMGRSDGGEASRRPLGLTQPAWDQSTPDD